MELVRVKPQLAVSLDLGPDVVPSESVDVSQGMHQLKELVTLLLSREDTRGYNKLLMYQYMKEMVRCGKGQALLRELELHIASIITEALGRINYDNTNGNESNSEGSEYVYLYEQLETYWCNLRRATCELMQICTPLQPLVKIGPARGTLWEKVMSYFKADRKNRPQLYEGLLTAALFKVKEYRDLKEISFCRLRNIVQLLQHIELYKEFMQRLSKCTKEFYNEWVKRLFNNSGVTESYAILQDTINMEKLCCSKYLAPASVNVIMDGVLGETLLPYADVLMSKSQLESMIVQGDSKSINLLRQLYKETKLKDQVTESVLSSCKDILSRLVSQYLVNPVDCKEFIYQLHDFYDTLNFIVKPLFTSEVDFKVKSKNIWQGSLNQSHETTQAVTAALAKYADRASLESTSNFLGEDGTVHFILYIFRFLTNKSYFELCFRSFLSMRLLYDQCISDNHRKVISIFKEECGATYVAKLENLTHDIETSQSIFSEFKKAESPFLADLKHPFSVVVISTDTWLPRKIIEHKNVDEAEFEETDVHQTDGIDALKPEGTSIKDIEKAQSTFAEFYKTSHKNKSLRYLPEFGSATISCEFNNGNVTSCYDFKLSIYQAYCILLLSECEFLTLFQLSQVIQGYNETLVRQHLGVLQGLECQLVVFHEYPNLTFETCTTRDLFKLNPDFHSDESFLDVGCRSLDMFSKEMTLVHKHVTFEDIVPSLESSIVRYLKQTLEATSTSLFKLCCNNQKYTLSRQEFNKVVDSLIEREFVQYDPNNKAVLQYMP